MNDVTNFVEGEQYLCDYDGRYEVLTWNGVNFTRGDAAFEMPDKVYDLPKRRTVTLKEVTPKKGTTYIILEPGAIFFGEWDGEQFYTTIGMKVKRKDNQIVFGMPKYVDIK